MGATTFSQTTLSTTVKNATFSMNAHSIMILDACADGLMIMLNVVVLSVAIKSAMLSVY